jgi:glyoxylate reductase
MNIFVTRLIPNPGLDLLQKHYPKFSVNKSNTVLSHSELSAKVHGLDGLLCLLTDKIDANIMDAAGSSLKVISNYAVGFDNIDIEAANRRGIMVTNTPGVLTEATADHAWALLFSIARRVVESDAFTRAGQFECWGPLMFLGGDITGRTLGIVGAGRIGTAMAQRSSGFNMRVLYCDSSPNKLLEQQLGAKKVTFEELLTESDYISIHVPLNEETHYMFNARSFEMMKESAYLINTARGPVIDEAALAVALKEGSIAGAALDVFEDEPEINADLFNLENIVLTPHIASATTETRNRMAVMAAQNLIDGLSGKRPENLVNP